MLNQIAKNYVSWLFLCKAKEKGSYTTHALTVAHLIVPRCNRIENVRNVKPSRLQVFYVLNGIKKLLHWVVEHTEIGSASYNVFSYDLGLVVKLVATFVEKIEKMCELVTFIVLFFAKSDITYMQPIHYFARRLSFSQRMLY